MNPQTLYNPQTGMKATPLPGVTQQQTQAAMTQGFAPILPSKDTSTQITTQNLGTTPIQLPVIQSTPVLTPTIPAPSGMVVDANGNLTQTAEPKDEKSSYAKAVEDYLSSGSELDKQGDTRLKLQEEQQVARKREEATKDYSAYLSAKQALQAQVEALYNSGGTQEGIARQVQELTRKGNVNLANLAIQAQLSQGLLADAEKTVNETMEAIYQPLRDKIEYQRAVVEMERNNMTEKEKFQLNKLADKNEREMKRVQDVGSSLLKSMNENRAPAALYSEITKINEDYNSGKLTATEAETEMYKTAGEYGTDVLERKIKEAQLEKMGVELSKAKMDVIEAQSKAEGADEVMSPYQVERNTRILQSVAELRQRVESRTVGLLSTFKFIPGTIQADFKTDLDTLKASIAFGELTAMREASKTGGALGQVSNIELGLLESALGGLSQSQSPANFKKNLDKIEASINRWNAAKTQVTQGTAQTGDTKVWGGTTYKVIDGVWTPQ